MGITPSLSGRNVGVIDPVMADSYSRNAGLALDANLTLMLRCEAYRPPLCWNVELLRLVSELKHEVHIWGPPRLTKDARSASGDLRV